MPLGYGIEIHCDVCNILIYSSGCCLYGDEHLQYPKDKLCNNCLKAVDHAREQIEYLKNYHFKNKMK